MEADGSLFSLTDYVIFCCSLLVTIAIGVYHALVKKPTLGEFLLGDGNLKVLPLTISLVVSVVSAVTLLGLPAEMYTQGTQYVFNFGSGLGILLTCVIFVPLLHPLKLTSMFEYLERRFKSRAVRTIGSLAEVLALLLYGGTALYAPATALSGVTPFSVWVLALSLGSFVTLYTALGGLRGVIWTDVFQSCVMIAGIIAVIIQGCISVGGIREVFSLNEQGDRLHFYNFDPDPRTRHTFWGLTVGFAFGGLSFYGASQFTFQRFTATKKLSDAKLTLLLNIPLFYFFHFLLCFTGLIIYAYYVKTGCDPLEHGLIQSSNQLLPIFVVQTLRSLPGLPGLFMAALTSGALSTLSSVINSVAALVWEDFLKSLLGRASEAKALVINKLIIAASGAIIISLTFVAHNFGPHIFQVSFALLGASGGPQLGMFLLGALVPWANAKGAISGCLAGLAMTLWVTVGAYITKPFSPPLSPGPEDGCIVNNFTTTITATGYNESYTHSSIQQTSGDVTYNTTGMDNQYMSSGGLNELYRLSYTWYTALGVCVCMVVGCLVSLVTGRCKPEEHLVLQWYRVFQKPWRCYHRSTQQHDKPEPVDKEDEAGNEQTFAMLKHEDTKLGELIFVKFPE